jgi:serine protease
LAVVSQDGVPFSQGGYEYTFSGIPAGNYQIFAGTDSDNDFVLGDPGEAFGAYLTLDQPLSVSVSENQDDLDFNSNFDVSLPAQMAAGVKPARPLLQRLKSWNLAK